MTNRARRTAIGTMLIDVAKYLLTAVAIGGLASERVVWRMVLVGLVMALLTGVIGCWVIPADADKEGGR